MKGYKELTLANFNCTFGKNEKLLEPMLAQFKEIIYPAFRDNRKVRNYYFYDIRLSKHDEYGFYISGRIVKDTVLEIKSRFNHISGELDETNEEHSSSPYSEFILLLVNHRLIFVKGQKGSPTISNLENLIKSNIKNKVKDFNAHCETVDEILPLYELNIVEIPKNKNIASKIKDFKSISKFSLKFFALNNDIPMEEFIKNMQEMRTKTKSKSLEPTFYNPEEKEYIGKLIEESDGLVEFSMTAIENDGEKSKIYKNGDFKEKIEIYLPEHETALHNDNLVINTVLLDNRMSVISEANRSMYSKIKATLSDLLS